MSTVLSVLSCSMHAPCNPPDFVEVFWITLVVNRNSYSHSLQGTLFLIMVQNHRRRNSRINPSGVFWFGHSSSVLVNCMLFLQKIFMNYVPGEFYTWYISQQRSSHWIILDHIYFFLWYLFGHPLIHRPTSSTTASSVTYYLLGIFVTMESPPIGLVVVSLC